ncbi:MAG: LysR family transcriptional regulator [Lachnospiraceae bacterium]|nr:LysR family transcriptional regulator [Lachnospiraceae bacterium]
MDYKWIEAFLALADYLNFSRAADSLYITQPALSKQIAALESYLGVRLFIRDSRTVELTEMGKLFLPEAQELLTKTNQTVDKMKKALNAERLNSGVLSIAFDRHLPFIFFARSPLMDAVRALKERYPLITLEFKYINLQNLAQTLRKPPGDIIITFIPSVELHQLEIKSNASRIIQKDSWMLAVPEEYSDCELSDEGDLARLNQLVFLDVKHAPTLLSDRLGCLGYFGLKPQILSCDNWDEIFMRTQLGEGFHLIPKGYTQSFQHPGITYLSLEQAGELSSLAMVLTWSDQNDNHLIDLLLQELPR